LPYAEHVQPALVGALTGGPFPRTQFSAAAHPGGRCRVPGVGVRLRSEGV